MKNTFLLVSAAVFLVSSYRIGIGRTTDELWQICGSHLPAEAAVLSSTL